jgi:hypothetical protein
MQVRRNQYGEVRNGPCLDSSASNPCESPAARPRLASAMTVSHLSSLRKRPDQIRYEEEDDETANRYLGHW